MKKVILTTVLLASAVGVFAQGKVGFKNDSSSLIKLASADGVLAADLSLAGMAVGNTTPLLSGRTLVAGLYGGTTSGNMVLQGTQWLNTANSPGVIATKSIILSGIGGIANNTAITAATPYFQVKVWETTYATYEAAPKDGTSYLGVGTVFQMNPGPSLSYVPTAPTSLNTTWSEVPIVVSVPEPTTAAIAGLGLASMLIFRRKK